MCVNRGLSLKINNTATMTAINEAEACTGWLHEPTSPHLHALSKTLCCGVGFGSNSLIAPYGWNVVRLTLSSTRNFILLKSTIGLILHWELVIKAATSSKWL